MEALKGREQDILQMLDYQIGAKISEELGSEIEVFGKKVKVQSISRRTSDKVSALWVKAKKNAEGELTNDKSNRTLDVRAASLILLDGCFGIKQRLFHWWHWRRLYNSSKYNTFMLNGIISKVVNSNEMLFFYKSVGLIKSIATERLKANQQK